MFEHLQDFIEGKLILSFLDEKSLLNNEVFKRLILPWEHDDKVVTLLTALLPGLCGTVKKLFADILGNGLWYNAPLEKRAKTLSIPKNDKFSGIYIWSCLQNFKGKAKHKKGVSML